MKTNVREDQLFIISDLHLGNPFFKTKRSITEFLNYVKGTNYSLCINGDGLDIAQTTITKLARDAPEIIAQLMQIAYGGVRIYYVVGNHDLVFEHFIVAQGGFRVVPFLNVLSGDKRIRVEHGHLYDPFFVRHPDLYEFSTKFAGYLLNFHPGFYRLLLAWERMRSKLARYNISGGIIGEPPAFPKAVHELAQRGFDVVIFGHTHHRGTVNLGDGKTYINSGSWLSGAPYIQIDHGKAELKTWL